MPCSTYVPNLKHLAPLVTNTGEGTQKVENGSRLWVVTGLSKSLKIAQFDRAHRNSYLPSIVSMPLSCSISEIYSEKIADFNLP